MNFTEFVIQILRFTAWPLVVVITVVLFKRELAGVFKAIDYLIRRRQFEAGIPGAYVKTASQEAETVQTSRRELEATPLTPPSTSKIQDSYEARSFILRDEAGRARVVIGFATQGEERDPYIQILDTKGNAKISLKLSESGTSGFLFQSAQGSSIAMLGTKTRIPFLAFTDPNDDLKTSLDTSSLRVADNKSYLGLLEDDTAALIFYDAKGEEISRVP